ncbi:hypothetical protein [Cypionkella sp. TWP1-2-1b2]|uniref:hypothetical protein n=1 Tax=Cypionkella sp. TWP1-2-1b2 TaxID=2804675 RepID=UPI003CED3F21
MEGVSGVDQGGACAEGEAGDLADEDAVRSGLQGTTVAVMPRRASGPAPARAVTMVTAPGERPNAARKDGVSITLISGGFQRSQVARGGVGIGDHGKKSRGLSKPLAMRDASVGRAWALPMISSTKGGGGCSSTLVQPTTH